MNQLAMLRIVVRRGAQYRHHALALDLVSQAQKADLAGATMLEIVSGFAGSGPISAKERWALSDAVAYEILIVDSLDRLDRFLDQVSTRLSHHAVVTIEPVTIVSGGTRAAEA